MEQISDSELARRLGVSRQAIDSRRRRGWTEEEIRAGRREMSTYPNAHYTKVIGKPVAEIAEEEGVSRVAIYKRLKRAEESRGKVRDPETEDD